MRSILMRGHFAIGIVISSPGEKLKPVSQTEGISREAKYRVSLFLGRLSLLLNFFFHHFLSPAPSTNGFAEKQGVSFFIRQPG